MSDARKLLFTRGVRGLADGVVSIALATYLTGLGFSAFEVGALVTGTLLGSAAVTLAVGLLGYRLSRRYILLGAAALMALTGFGFAGLTAFWPLMIVAVAGTLNPSSGDVSVFLPTEQAALAHTVAGPARTKAFAWFNVVGIARRRRWARWPSGLPAWIASHRGVALLRAERGVFVFYAACAVAVAVVYTRLSPALEIHPDEARPGAAGRVAGDRAPAVGPVQHRLVRRRLRRAVAAGAVATPPLRPGRAHDRRRVLRRRRARRVLAGPRRRGSPRASA